MKLYLIRHGKCELNERGCYMGSTNQSLSSSGRAELERLASVDGYLPELTDVVLYSSGMNRTEETLRIYFGDVSHRIEKDFRECDFGIFEGRNYEELKNDPQYISWIEKDNMVSAPPNGESYITLKARVLGALDRVLKEGRNLAIVTHGGPIVAIMESLFPEEGKNFYEWSLHNGEYYEVNVEYDTLSGGSRGIFYERHSLVNMS